MKEKIIALVFGVLALVLEILISIKTPSVESIVASVLAAVIVVTMVVLIIQDKRRKDLPEDS